MLLLSLCYISKCLLLKFSDKICFWRRLFDYQKKFENIDNTGGRRTSDRSVDQKSDAAKKNFGKILTRSKLTSRPLRKCCCENVVAKMLKRSPLSKVLAPPKTLLLNDTLLFKSTQNSLVPHQIDSSNFEKLYHRWSKFRPKTRCRAQVNCFDQSPKRELEMFLLLYFDFNSVNSFSDFFVFRIVASVETSEK